MVETSRKRTSRGLGRAQLWLFLIVTVFSTLGACRTVRQAFGGEQWSAPTGAAASRAGAGGHRGATEPTTIQTTLIDSAHRMVGYNGSSVHVRGRDFPMDCTGLVLALYYEAGIDLSAEFGAYRGNGVSRLHQYLDDLELLRVQPPPAPGDLIFWDNTYDRNENQKFDDPLTHVGMVVAVDPDGTIHFIHHNYREGAVIVQMDLANPHSWEKNVPMRMRGAVPRIENRILASQLVNAYGQAWRVDP